MDALASRGYDKHHQCAHSGHKYQSGDQRKGHAVLGGEQGETHQKLVLATK